MSHTRYNYSFDIHDESTAAKVVRCVGENKSVLELGCSCGVMTQVLSEHYRCKIFAVDSDSVAAENAKKYCEKLIIADIDRIDWNELLGLRRFDVIVAADVLEHLVNPDSCLQILKNFLAPDGYFVLSVPNSAYNGIIAELLHEDFRYRETGLLDSTHLRFFGLEGIRRLMASAGLAIESAETTRIDPETSEFCQAWISLPEWLASGMKARPLGDVYQYVIKARPEGAHKEALKFGGLREGLPVSDQYENRIAEAERVAEQAHAEVETARSKVEEMELLVERMKCSASWRVTRPFRFVARLCRHGFLDQDRLFLFHGIRNRYHRLPLPTFVKKTISFSYHQVLKRFLRKFSRSLDRSVPFAVPSIQPSPQGEAWDYIVWGVIDWHFRHQRPQQLALAMAETGCRVFYISPNLIDDERPGFSAEKLTPGGRVFQVNLFAEGAPSIYSSAPSPETVAQIRQSIGEVLDWADSRHVVSLVDHPFWHDIARVVPNSRLVYDCMDHHEGFGNNEEALLRLERQLIAEADVTITTSSWLENAVAPHARNVEILRNACDYEHFSRVPTVVHRDPHGRPVIGYYGAIAEWFDLDLVEAVAKSHPDCSVMLIGADTVNAKSRLGKLPNVTFTGEVPYGLLPQYLHGFDVCLLPFKIIPLTLATNPVKAYEYLSAGKPVVAVDLPEMSQFDGLIRVAADRDEFVRAVREAMETLESDETAQKRRAFARSQTWGHRAESLRGYSEDMSNDPRVSVVVVTYNNLELTKACLASIDAHSQYGNLEVIVVDNASSDGTQGYLEEWVSGRPDRKIINNGQNKGFAAANNQGLASATGDYLVLLNNDTYVTPGWIRTLARHLERDKTIGLIGPVTNNIGNEAKIYIAYGGMDEMLAESAKYTRRHIGQQYPLRTAAFFCAMMPRAVYERVGDLDESFGRGFFEDDDYCRRIEQAGLRIVCAEDVFVHHHLSASFNMIRQQERRALFEKNKALYESKWGAWLPHGYRVERQTVQRRAASACPSIFFGQKHVSGRCNICGNETRFFYQDESLWRESLVCLHCRSTSRYRSVAKGVLRAIHELTGITSSSLASLPKSDQKKLKVYDTQVSFSFEPCAYPIPDCLKKTGWIDVVTSRYLPGRKLGEIFSDGSVNQNLECLTFPCESLDIVITSDVMEHVRLDERAHKEIFRVLKPGGIYVFTVPHVRTWTETCVRVQIVDPEDSSKDVHILDPEYHGDANSPDGERVLAYRTYGLDLNEFLENLGFDVNYYDEDDPVSGIQKAELYYCVKTLDKSR